MAAAVVGPGASLFASLHSLFYIPCGPFFDLGASPCSSAAPPLTFAPLSAPLRPWLLPSPQLFRPQRLSSPRLLQPRRFRLPRPPSWTWLLPSPRLARALPYLPLHSPRSLRPLLRLDKVSGLPAAAFPLPLPSSFCLGSCSPGASGCLGRPRGLGSSPRLGFSGLSVSPRLSSCCPGVRRFRLPRPPWWPWLLPSPRLFRLQRLSSPQLLLPRRPAFQVASADLVALAPPLASAFPASASLLAPTPSASAFQVASAAPAATAQVQFIIVNMLNQLYI
jgi:hypothetical protein